MSLPARANHCTEARSHLLQVTQTGGGFRAVPSVQLAQDTLDVFLYRPLSDHQLRAYLTIASTASDQLEDLAFARRQPAHGLHGSRVVHAALAVFLEKRKYFARHHSRHRQGTLLVVVTESPYERRW